MMAGVSFRWGWRRISTLALRWVTRTLAIFDVTPHSTDLRLYRDDARENNTERACALSTTMRQRERVQNRISVQIPKYEIGNRPG